MLAIPLILPISRSKWTSRSCRNGCKTSRWPFDVLPIVIQGMSKWSKNHPCCKALQSCTLSKRSKPTHTVLLLLLLFHVEMVEIYIQYSINNVISNSKSSNKCTIRFTVWTTTKFKLRCPKTSIYRHFELSLSWNAFDLMELRTNRVRINHAF